MSSLTASPELGRTGYNVRAGSLELAARIAGEVELGPEREPLTPAGQAFAEAHEAESLVARVALAGYASSWPAFYVATAIRACNAGTYQVGGCCV